MMSRPYFIPQAFTSWLFTLDDLPSRRERRASVAVLHVCVGVSQHHYGPTPAHSPLRHGAFAAQGAPHQLEISKWPFAKVSACGRTRGTRAIVHPCARSWVQPNGRRLALHALACHRQGCTKAAAHLRAPASLLTAHAHNSVKRTDCAGVRPMQSLALSCPCRTSVWLIPSAF